jgi:hypothetical protein
MDRTIDLQLIETVRSHYADYHNHKETVAMSIFGVETAFCLGLFFLGARPLTMELIGVPALVFVVVVVWILFHTTLRFQLRNKRMAAIYVAASLDALWRREPPAIEGGKLHAEDRTSRFVDTFVWPRVGIFRTFDPSSLDSSAREAESSQSAAALDAWIVRHEADSRMYPERYGYPIEVVVTLGSFFLLFLALCGVIFYQTPAT